MKNNYIVWNKKRRDYYKKLGGKYKEALNEMIVFDAIICNLDRHYVNLGYLIDNKTNKKLYWHNFLIMIIVYLILLEKIYGRVKKSLKNI